MMFSFANSKDDTFFHSYFYRQSKAVTLFWCSKHKLNLGCVSIKSYLDNFTLNWCQCFCWWTFHLLENLYWCRCRIYEILSHCVKLVICLLSPHLKTLVLVVIITFSKVRSHICSSSQMTLVLVSLINSHHKGLLLRLSCCHIMLSDAVICPVH